MSITSAQKFIENISGKKGKDFEKLYFQEDILLAVSPFMKYFKKEKIKHDYLKNIFKLNNYYALSSRISSPLIAMQTEELAALKVKSILHLGIAGSISDELKMGDIFVSKGTFHETGIGKIYGYDFSELIPSNNDFSDKIFAVLKEKFSNIKMGLHWTTDAPMMETLEKVNFFSKMNAKCVEMEAAGIFSVANKYNIPTTSIYVISDELHSGQWIQGWQNKNYLKTIENLTSFFAQ